MSATLLVRLDLKSRVPLRRQLEHELRAAIHSRRLVPGARLPSSRELADDLQVSRGLVVEAYEQLLAEGYLVARLGSGTVVARSAAVAPKAPPQAEAAPVPLRFDFRPGVPDLGLFPRRAWLASLRHAVREAAPSALGYPDARGMQPVRAALSAYLNRARGANTHAGSLVICTGFAQGLRIICQALRAQGVRRVAVEDPWHAMQRATVRAAGFEVVAIPTDEEGLRTERLEKVGADAVIVTPAHQFPTGAVLSAARRSTLMEWADRRRAMVVEDDYDAEYRYDREPIGSLQGLAPERVVSCGSVSKTLAPALRLGWLAAPSHLVGALAAVKREEDLGCPVLEQLALADFIARGEFDRHLRRSRAQYKQRRNALVKAIQEHCCGWRVHGVAAGLHLVAQLPSGADEKRYIAAAAKRSIGIYGLSGYRFKSGGFPGLILGYGSLPTSAITAAVRLLAAALEGV